MLDNKFRFRGEVQTLNAVPVPLSWQIENGLIVTDLDFPINTVAAIRLGLLAISGTDVAAWSIVAGLKMLAVPPVLVVGAPNVVSFKDPAAAAWTLFFASLGASFRIQVSGAPAAVTDWRAELEITFFQP